VESIDVLVVGAGVSGLASALAVAAGGRASVLVIDRHPRPGLDTSTRNSGVIHAGIYYPGGTLKARLSVEGRHLLYPFCAEWSVPHARCGKFIVAANDDEALTLSDLRARGIENGVEGLELVDARFVSAREPHVRAAAALYSPESGVVDQEALVKGLVRAGDAAGVIFLPATRLVDAVPASDGVIVRTERETIHARQVVNAAGLYADEVSRALGGESFTIYPCRGEYAELTPAKRSLVHGLVYPLPRGHGLGVHLIRSTDGTVRLGPTDRYQQRKDDYEDGRLPVEAFVEPAQRLLPAVTLEDLRLSGSGIRAKLHPPEQAFADFLIRRDRDNPAVVQAAGIDSPGLTSCLAVGRLVSRIVAEAV
jgi:L-2-hydroxyglutarate oxidase LhgO